MILLKTSKTEGLEETAILLTGDIQTVEVCKICDKQFVIRGSVQKAIYSALIQLIGKSLIMIQYTKRNTENCSTKAKTRHSIPGKGF